MDNEFNNGSQDFEDSQEGGNQGNSSSDFSIPEEYKDKGWTKFFDGKSGDELKTELFRSYDNSQTLIGKKVEDYIKTTDLKSLDNYEEIKEALNKQIGTQAEIPENAEAYAFNDILKNEDGSLMYEYPEDALGYFGDKFKELGLTKEQGQGLLKTYTQFEIEEFQKYTNADDLNNNINAMFNNNQQQRQTVEGLLKEFLPQQDQEFLQKTAPNYTIEMFYRVAKGLVDKYGYKEGSANSSNPAKIRMSEADKNAEYDRLYQKLVSLDSRPNQKVGERDEIINQMRQLFQ
jgi:hypothetical protein